MKPTLVVLAAGIGARYGKGIKQLDPVGPNGELIIDYSICDAVRAGFERIVLIIRHEIYDDFQKAIGERLEKNLLSLGVELIYGFQDMDGLPAGRKKPWGTGQALLSCKELLTGPFAVINADDYYGPNTFKKAYKFLVAYDQARPNRYGVIGFTLKNTLSDSGGVTRGICSVGKNGLLMDICETHNIIKTVAGPAVMVDGKTVTLDPKCLVSMNMWMLTPSFVAALEDGFAAFRKEIKDPMKDEYLLPTIIGWLVRSGKATVEVLPTEDAWFGMTYPADKPKVEAAIRALIEAGTYG